MDPLGQPAIRVSMMPADTNANGTIFGGIILSYIDQAGAVEACKVCRHKVVTVAMHEVIFLQPVQVGDLVSFYTSTEKVGRTSIRVRVRVKAHRQRQLQEAVDVTEAVVVYVAIDDQGRPRPISDSPAPPSDEPGSPAP